MFGNKVIGAAREKMLSLRFEYYEIKDNFLLSSPTLSAILTPALSIPSFVIPFSSEGHSILVVEKTYVTLVKCMKHTIQQNQSRNVLFIFEDDYKLVLNNTISVSLQYATANILDQSAFFVADQTKEFTTNKARYIYDKIIVSVLRWSSWIGPVSQLLFLSVHYYNTGRYHRVQRITGICLKRFSKPYILYYDITNEQEYNALVNIFPLGERMQKAWMGSIAINHHLFYLEKSNNLSRKRYFVLIYFFMCVSSHVRCVM